MVALEVGLCSLYQDQLFSSRSGGSSLLVETVV